MGHNDLDSLRKNVAQTDDNIIDLLSKRFEFTDEIGRIKKQQGLQIENGDVEKRTVERLSARSIDKLDKEFVSRLYSEIFKESKERQKNV